MAHGTLTSLRGQILDTFPKYKPEFKEATAAYTAAVNGYPLYRSSAGHADISAALGNLTASIVALKSAFLNDMNVSPAQAPKTRHKSGTSAHGRHYLRCSLEIAAALAQTVPAAPPDAALARVVIEAASQALARRKRWQDWPSI